MIKDRSHIINRNRHEEVHGAGEMNEFVVGRASLIGFLQEI